MPVGFIAFGAFNIAGYFNRSHDSVVDVVNRHVRPARSGSCRKRGS